MISLSRKRHAPARLAAWALLIGALALAGCTSQPNGGGGGKGANFGDQKNHIHAMLALPGQPGTLLVGTHYGLYRTTNGGQTWKKVLGDPGELAAGLMDLNLTGSPTNPQRVYVVAVTFPDLPKSSGVPGLYTSGDAGATWKLVTPLTSLPSSSPYYLVAGPQGEQLYAYFQRFQDKGLYESSDGGTTWQALGTLPDSSSLGLVVDPAKPGHLFTYSASGLFESADNGSHWQAAPGVKDGIQRVALSSSMVYATGDDGTYVSRDGGDGFTLVPQSQTFQFLASSPQSSSTVFGLSGSTVSISSDGGQTWKLLTIPPDHLLAAYLVVAPDNSQEVILGNSYPVAIYTSANSGQNWSQVAP